MIVSLIPMVPGIKKIGDEFVLKSVNMSDYGGGKRRIRKRCQFSVVMHKSREMAKFVLVYEYGLPGGVCIDKTVETPG